jgi:hypothetical protein
MIFRDPSSRRGRAIMFPALSPYVIGARNQSSTLFVNKRNPKIGR